MVGIGVCVDVIRVDTDDVGTGVNATEVGDVDNVALSVDVRVHMEDTDVDTDVSAGVSIYR